MTGSTPGDVQLLRAIRYELARYVGPVAAEGKAATTMRMVDDALAHIIMRRERGDDWQADDNAALQDLLAEDAVKPQAADTLAEGNRLMAALEHRLSGAQDGAEPMLLGLNRLHRRATERAQAFARADFDAYAAQRETLEDKVTADRFQAYLRRRFPGRDALVTDFRELSGGFSKTTFMVEVAGLEAEPCSIVVKRDMAASATRTSAVDEFPLLRGLFDAGILVPEPLWTETDPEQLGYPFLVMRRVAGNTAGTLFGLSEDCTEQVVRDLAAQLGKLHGLDPRAIDLGPAFAHIADPHAEMLAEVERWRSLWLETRQAPDPLLAGAMRWLETHVPPLPERLSIVHGDPGFQNQLCAGGHLTALIDWEFTHAGDPIENLSFLRPFIEQRLPWAEFMAIYQAHGGGAYDDELGAYYRVWHGVRFTVCTLLANRAFCTDENPELRMGHCGIVAYQPIVVECGAMVDHLLT